MKLDADFVGAILTAATPLMFAALAGFICFKAGIFNIAIEGQMLIAAFTAAVVAHYTHSAILAVLAGCAASTALVGAVVLGAYAGGVNVLVGGIAANILADGLSALLVRKLTGDNSSLTVTDGRLPRLSFGAIGHWPGIGEVLRGQTPLVLVCLAMVPAVHVALRRTRTGLAIRALGESADAVRTAGLSVVRVRVVATVGCGILAGLAGSQLALGPATSFSVGMTNGRGFTALVAAMIGGTVWSCVLGCLLFGGAEAFGLQIQLTGTSLPAPVVQMVPYALALVVLGVASRALYRRVDRAKRGVVPH